MILNTDHEVYGSGASMVQSISGEPVSRHGQQYSALVTLPSLATMWFEVAGVC